MPQTVSFLGYNFELGGEVILLLLLGDRNKDIVLGGADVDGGHRGSCALDPELGFSPTLYTLHSIQATL